MCETQLGSGRVRWSDYLITTATAMCYQHLKLMRIWSARMKLSVSVHKDKGTSPLLTLETYSEPGDPWTSIQSFMFKFISYLNHLLIWGLFNKIRCIPEQCIRFTNNSCDPEQDICINYLCQNRNVSAITEHTKTNVI